MSGMEVLKYMVERIIREELPAGLKFMADVMG